MKNELQDRDLVKQAASGSGTARFQFRTPAAVRDFADSPEKQKELDLLWSKNLDGFTQQGMTGSPWNVTNTPATTNYYNPINGIPAGQNQGPAAVQWSAFPGRLAYNFPTSSQAQLEEMADTGSMPKDISSNPCTSSSTEIPYYPYGPRGWQDEYCEWAVTRNSDNKITRIDFTCDNPEYFNTLWQVDPNKVLEIYRSTLNKPQITLDDLTLPGAINPINGKTSYNPLNKWNTGPDSTSLSGGAMHLTSTPNTIQTEIAISSAATVLRNNPSGTTGNTTWPSSEYNALLCDAQYGQKYRNSDPNIGGNINNFVNQGYTLTLTDPLGLYIQMPNFSVYTTPDGSDASTFWTIVRGSKTLNDQDGNQLPGNFILHAVFEVPADKGYVVGDISIGGAKIEWGSQVANTFKMQVLVDAYSAPIPQGYNAVGNTTPTDTFAQPVQLFFQSYYQAMTGLVKNPVNNPIPLLSNSTFIAPTIPAGSGNIQMVLTCATCTAVNGEPQTYPSITFDDPNITATVDVVLKSITYAVPGNSQPAEYSALQLTVDIGPNATPGLHGVFITNPSQAKSVAMPALLNVTLQATVQANQTWQNTGITMPSDSPITISYLGGLWTANPNDNNGALYDANGNPTFIPAQSGYTLPGANEGALIGYVGTNPLDSESSSYFLIGDGPYVVPSGTSGNLWLCINDDLNGIHGQGLKDNKGSVTVQVAID